MRTTDGEIYAQARQFAEECDNDDIVTQMQNVDTRLYLAEDILTKVDRASMAVSLEVRAPFLDPRVAEFAASLPCSYKLRGLKTKYILKKAVRDHVAAVCDAARQERFWRAGGGVVEG